MAGSKDEPSYMDVFENYYTKLTRGLPAGAMWDDFVGKGLLRDVTLREQIKAESTDSGKTRLLLESMRQGLSNRNNATFLKFLEAMKEYGDYSKNPAVLDLVEDIRKDLPARGDKNSSKRSTTLPSKDPPTLPDLLSSLKEVVNWDTFASFLLPKEHQSQIAIIRRSKSGDVDDCKMELYNYYLRVGNLSWKTVVDALEKSSNTNIAKKIKQDYY